MKSKLEALFAIDAIDGDAGVMINEYNDIIQYLTIKYEDYFHVFLHLCDNQAPFRDILPEGIDPTLEIAQEIAVRNLSIRAYVNMN